MSEFAETDPADLDRDLDDIDPTEPDPEQDAVADGPTPHEEVDDADLLEQATPVDGPDEDYPNDLEVEPDV